MQTKSGYQVSLVEERTRRRKMPGGGLQDTRQYTSTGSKRVLGLPIRVRFREKDVRNETEEEETEDRETNIWEMENKVTVSTEGEVSGRSLTDLCTTDLKQRRLLEAARRNG